MLQYGTMLEILRLLQNSNHLPNLPCVISLVAFQFVRSVAVMPVNIITTLEDDLSAKMTLRTDHLYTKIGSMTVISYLEL